MRPTRGSWTSSRTRAQRWRPTSSPTCIAWRCGYDACQPATIQCQTAVRRPGEVGQITAPISYTAAGVGFSGPRARPFRGCDDWLICDRSLGVARSARAFRVEHFDRVPPFCVCCTAGPLRGHRGGTTHRTGRGACRLIGPELRMRSQTPKTRRAGPRHACQTRSGESWRRDRPCHEPDQGRDLVGAIEGRGGKEGGRQVRSDRDGSGRSRDLFHFAPDKMTDRQATVDDGPRQVVKGTMGVKLAMGPSPAMLGRLTRSPGGLLIRQLARSSFPSATTPLDQPHQRRYQARQGRLAQHRRAPARRSR